MDGTLIKRNLNVLEVKKKLKMDNSEKTILDFINDLDDINRKKAMSILEEYECCAAEKSELNEGVSELLEYIQRKNIKTAVVTRNNKNAVQIVSQKFGLKFDAVVSREDAKPKPDARQLYAILSKLELDKTEVIFVGDHRFDLESGKSAGVITVLIKNPSTHSVLNQADFVIESIDEVIKIIENKNQ